ncbi:MAG TPA: hypothetical protein VL175_18310 [Pirellulales bacterium]|jgi:hypothetical protein|nr:hypothetical protein [Pirellulales bacterium]
MSSEPEGEDEDITNRIIKAGFTSVAPEIIARIREITAAEPSLLQTDPNALADDLQTVAALALHTHENVEMLIQVLQQLSKAGSISVTRPDKPKGRGGRF